MPSKPFPTTLLATLYKSKIIGLRAGEAPHRFIGVWPVLVKDRLFVRPWNNKPSGWYAAFLKEPYGVLQVGEREVLIKTRKARGENLMDAIDAAYAEKYPTPGSRNYVKGFAQARRRAATLELLPK
jgi:hypothetical protein